MRCRGRGQAPAAQCEVEAGPHGVDAEAAEVASVAQQGVASDLDERTGGSGADARYAQQHLERSPHDFEREALRMGQRPRRLGIVLERKVAAALERQLL